MPELAGMLTAMVTPFDEEGVIDEATAVDLGRWLLEQGNDGLVICGTTGEAATLTDEEQLAFIATMAAELGSEALIVAGVGSNDTRHAVHLTESAAAIEGVSALLSVNPYYNRPNRRGIRAHFEAVASAAGGVPVILYNVPTRTGTNMPIDLLQELAEIDGIDGLKESNNDQLTPIDGLALLTGNDDHLAAAMDKGAVGIIGVATHVAAPVMRRIIDEPEHRAELDATLRVVYDAMFCTASPAPVKAALAMLGPPVGGMRLPLVPCDEAEEATVRRALSAAGLLTPTTS
jgi:4-hydroxy-tetrahydrodipicolinate synthase